MDVYCWLFVVTALSVLLSSLVSTVQLEGCRSETSIYGMMLQGHTFQFIESTTSVKCVQACNADVRCQSINFVMHETICELNNRTKEARPMDFIPNVQRYYMKKPNKRVPLGSIVQLPAETCKEIKLSEGEHVAVSGMYWLDSIKPGTAVLVHCDMITEDFKAGIISSSSVINAIGSVLDECSATVPVCNNGVCHNTLGSYTCSCDAGYSTVDGITCIDECVTGAHTCHSSATCVNNTGSFSCVCNHGYIGDGKTNCIQAPECFGYASLSNEERKETVPTVSWTCDKNLGPDWFRFEGAAGTKMASSCPPLQHCGAHAPGWLSGTHPSVDDGIVTRQVCFHYYSNCCQWSISIQVRNCTSFFVYYISGTPPSHPCNLVYCGAQ